jgi:YVTN family beta-propeller protein
VTISAAASLATGYYEVSFDAHASNGAVIPGVSLLVTVTQPGQSIPVGSGPDGLTVAGGDLFVANDDSNNVTVIDTSTNAVIKTIPVGSVAADVAATPRRQDRAGSSFGDGTVQPIDVATLTAGTPVTVGSQPERLAVSPDGSQLWVASQGSGTVSDVSLATDTVTHTITVGAAPFGVGGHPGQRPGVHHRRRLIHGVGDRRGDGQRDRDVPTGSDPQYVQISPDGTTAWVVDTNVNNVVATGTPRGGGRGRKRPGRRDGHG